MLNTDTKQLAGNILAQILGGLATSGQAELPTRATIGGLVDVAILSAKALEEAAKKA